MIKPSNLLLMGLCVALSGPVLARDTVLQIPLAEVLETPDAKEKLDPNFRFYLAGTKTPKIVRTLGSDVANPKTNAFNKSDEAACRHVILSGLLALERSGKAAGANAVVDLVSFYKKKETRSASTIECHAGGFVAGAALKGQYAKVDH